MIPCDMFWRTRCSSRVTQWDHRCDTRICPGWCARPRSRWSCRCRCSRPRAAARSWRWSWSGRSWTSGRTSESQGGVRSPWQPWTRHPWAPVMQDMIGGQHWPWEECYPEHPDLPAVTPGGWWTLDSHRWVWELPVKLTSAPDHHSLLHSSLSSHCSSLPGYCPRHLSTNQQSVWIFINQSEVSIVIYQPIKSQHCQCLTNQKSVFTWPQLLQSWHLSWPQQSWPDPAPSDSPPHLWYPWECSWPRWFPCWPGQSWRPDNIQHVSTLQQS